MRLTKRLHTLQDIFPNKDENGKIESITIMTETASMTFDLDEVALLKDDIENILEMTLEPKAWIGPTKL